MASPLKCKFHIIIFCVFDFMEKNRKRDFSFQYFTIDLVSFRASTLFHINLWGGLNARWHGLHDETPPQVPQTLGGCIASQCGMTLCQTHALLGVYGRLWLSHLRPLGIGGHSSSRRCGNFASRSRTPALGGRETSSDLSELNF